MQSCKSPTAPNNYRLNLSITDVSCTEAWIKLAVNSNIPLPTKIVINRNGNNLFSFKLASRDTTVYDSTLLPNQSYTYQAEYDKGYPTERSETVTAKTMDTTSNNFTFQTFTFGASNAGSSHLQDVAIINDTDIWCVGAVYLDSANGAPDPFPYNVVHWNGKNWNLLKVPYYYQGKAFYSPIYSVYAFNANDIWFEAGIHWNGSQFETVPLNIDFTSHVNKIWGTSDNDLYIVGNNGLIARKSGDGTWQKIESGVTFNITDIYGVQNTSDNSSTIFMPLYNNENSLTGSALLRLTGNRAEIISTPQNLFEAQSVWAKNNNIVYLAGTGLFINAYGKWMEEKEFTMKSLTGIRAHGLNDIFVIGSTRSGHFNGKRWTIYNELNLPNGVYSSIDFKSNMVIMAGYKGSSAIVTIGKR